MVFVGVLGHGVVGSGVVEVLLKNKESIGKRAGKEVLVKRILDLRDFPNLAYSGLFTKNADDILNDPEISIVVEVMGGIEPAYEFTKRALEAGKFVVTSNKELVAEHGAELVSLAHKNQVDYLFEASVGGGIPIIRPLKQCLAGNNISEITGILNGTTNYILSEMKNKGKDFDQALSDAQANGYAERDPSSDIDGIDAQRKIAILCSVAFEQQVSSKEIKTQGISSISKEDMAYAKELGYVIKLIAQAQRSEEGISAMVSPMLLPETHPLADVEDVFNAILVKGDAIGDV
ncbi:MAG: homoserine dehydrogenase, partial [Eubacteriales bacterium]